MKLACVMLVFVFELCHEPSFCSSFIGDLYFCKAVDELTKATWLCSEKLKFKGDKYFCDINIDSIYMTDGWKLEHILSLWVPFMFNSQITFSHSITRS